MKRHHTQSGLTLVEAMISLALLSLLAASAFTALESANRQAMTTRLYTLAGTMARDQVDRLQTLGPFNPQQPAALGGAQIPPELALDSTRGGPQVDNVTLYTDPASNKALVTARMTTSVTDAGAQNARAIRVQVDFQFRGRNHKVQLGTLRTSDSP